MTLSVQSANPRDSESVALLEASHALMEQLFPSESNHYLSVEDLCAADVRFFTACDDGQTHGCGALALKGNYAEIKSMFVAPGARGLGVADALLAALFDAARTEGVSVLRLETGNALHAAHALYRKHGFVVRGPFGDYPDDPLSVFMERAL